MPNAIYCMRSLSQTAPQPPQTPVTSRTFQALSKLEALHIWFLWLRMVPFSLHAGSWSSFQTQLPISGQSSWPPHLRRSLPPSLSVLYFIFLVALNNICNQIIFVYIFTDSPSAFRYKLYKNRSASEKLTPAQPVLRDSEYLLNVVGYFKYRRHRTQ